MLKDLSLVMGKEIFRGYRLRQLRGRGTFGTVWEAEREGGETVALKFLPSADALANRAEIKAIQMISALYHPNLTPVHDVWAYKKYFVVAMELAEGSLTDLLEVYQTEFSSAIDPKDLCPLLSDAAKGIDFLNSRRHMVEGRTIAVQHCDIKPSNLLLFGDTLKLADFGLATVTTTPVKFHRPVGTPAYMAPEVFQGRLSDWSDQFSLAVTYYYLRTGKMPFSEAAMAQAAERYTWPAPDLSLLPDKEQAVISRGLSVVPQSRWPSCGEMMARLTESVNEPVKVVKSRTTQQGIIGRGTHQGVESKPKWWG